MMIVASTVESRPIHLLPVCEQNVSLYEVTYPTVKSVYLRISKKHHLFGGFGHLVAAHT